MCSRWASCHYTGKAVLLPPPAPSINVCDVIKQTGLDPSPCPHYHALYN